MAVRDSIPNIMTLEALYEEINFVNFNGANRIRVSNDRLSLTS